MLDDVRVSKITPTIRLKSLRLQLAWPGPRLVVTAAFSAAQWMPWSAMGKLWHFRMPSRSATPSCLDVNGDGDGDECHSDDDNDIDDIETGGKWDKDEDDWSWILIDD